MPSKLELHNVAISTTSMSLEPDDTGMIPPNLARLTETILKIHKVNGDLAWVQDLAHDMEVNAEELMNVEGLTPFTLACIANGLAKAADASQTEDEKLAIMRQFNHLTEEIENLMGVDWLTKNVISIK